MTVLSYHGIEVGTVEQVKVTRESDYSVMEFTTVQTYLNTNSEKREITLKLSVPAGGNPTSLLEEAYKLVKEKIPESKEGIRNSAVFGKSKIDPQVEMKITFPVYT